MSENKSQLLQGVINISIEVGKFLLAEQGKVTSEDVELKGHNDFVSYVDKTAEKKFIAKLETLLPEAGFIAEEGTSSKRGDVYNWIIDPLDGTSNYLYHIPAFCTSVGLVKNNELILGVVYDPTHDELFYAEKGSGAFLNDRPIKVSKVKNVAGAFYATGFPYDPGTAQNTYLEILKNVLNKSRGVRRLGSAALDICYVACGRFDAFYEHGLHPWDCAAGALIVMEAGGKVSDFSGAEDYLFGETFLCTNGVFHEEALDMVKGWDN